MPWWVDRPIQLIGRPFHIPLSLPCLQQLEAIFTDYRCNFRRFESWHVGQRAKILWDKHAVSRDALFHELRDRCPPQVDTLELRHTHTVLAVEPGTGTARMDSCPDLGGHSAWSIDGQPLDLDFVGADLCRPSSGPVLGEDDATLIHEEFV